VPQAVPSVLQVIGKELREQLGPLSAEPLPEPLRQLIEALEANASSKSSEQPRPSPPAGPG
jgi:hypothetical protein